MTKIKLLSLLLLSVLLLSMKGDLEAFKLFDANGKNVKYSKLADAAGEADIVFFGELHNNPISHWFQLELTKELFSQKSENLILGAEMFESDNQLIMDEYLSGQITDKNFEAEARLWKNYKTDYKPLVDFAKDHQLKFVATNIPRRYASMVHKKGFETLDSLSPEAKFLIAPLPVKYDAELKGYKAMLEGMEGMGSHASSNLPKAQAIKDATMAHFILENWEKGKTFIHYNGAYHSNDFEGIVWYLKQENPRLNILTISTVEQDTITDLNEDFKNLADFILCVPTDMTKTY
ncbi:MAG: ChaN family lipoprotein [Bacteroidales bacterium]